MPKYESTRHAFTVTIIEVLRQHFGEYAEDIFSTSPLLGYLNSKSRSAHRGSKARGAFANHYALYVIVEDYIKKGFLSSKAPHPYSKYEGTIFRPIPPAARAAIRRQTPKSRAQCQAERRIS